LNSLATAILYCAPFILFIFAPPGLDAVFLAGYVTVIFATLGLTIKKDESSIEGDIGFYSGVLAVVPVLVILSFFLLFLFGIMGREETKYISSTWIFLSLFFPLGAPVNLARLGVLLRKGGWDLLAGQFPTRTGLQHFFVEYSTFRWYRHGYYFLISLLMFGLYLYGWSLLDGTPVVLYAIGLFVLMQLLLSGLVKRLLAPFSAIDVISRIESLYPVRTLTLKVRRPSPPGFIVILAFLTLAGYYWLVDKAFVGANLAIFSMLFLVYIFSLWFYTWTIKAQPTKPI
jgi:hypothetical protein